ncbi:translocation/assembly module TamB domain-containing protein [Fortiea sp. LEGE XX443]|uniref:translocation/assembly module TamB domain-containing protein n=1 Tax=Fortiea sp. LEGE XX443 TaxID=1828611 RepID=UPI00187E7FC3|nr:translocation/assembly module TamB domain-containing protein [Fortiea sp. LEGE XX443]MBE9004812.1 translocation/assembly module TamB domain-containing protein [Fortiea sp. LEGE XX443]
MTNSHNQEPQSQSRTRMRMWLLMLSRVGIPLLGILLVGIIVGIWRLQSFVQKELAPLAEESITNTINRPVKLGKVTNFSLTGVQFGASEIPSTPTDPDKAAVAAVEVGFNPWQLVFNRQLKLDVTLVNADVYIAQDEQGRWITTTIAPPGQSGLIKTDLDNLRLRNAKLMLLPQKKGGGVSSPVTFAQLNGSAQLLENNQLIKFDVGGQAESGGNVAIKGQVRPKTLVADIQLRGQDLLAPEITSLVKLPLNLQAGRVNGDLQVKLAPEQKPLIYGSADLQKVTLQIPRVPQLLTSTGGDIYFKGTEIRLDNLTTNYGKIPLIANGIIDSQAGYKLTGRVKAVSVANAQTTLNVKLPVPVAGQAKADLQITGAATNPILSGTVATINTARIDKVNFKSVSSKFRFSPNAALLTLTDIQGETTVGGQITGVGKIALGKAPLLNLNFAARGVAGDAIAKIYDSNPTFKIGKVAATAQVTGTPTNVKTLVKWQVPQATYPGTGETIVTSDRTVYFQNVALKVGGGVVRAAGSYANERWQAVATGNGVKLEPFVNKNQLQNISLAGAEFNGRLILAGSTAPFQIASIRTQGAAVQIAGGAIAINSVQLQDQNFSAELVANNVRLGRILKQAPPALQGSLAGKFQIAGNTENISLKTLRGTGQANLSVAGGTVTATNIQLANGAYKAQLVANNLAVQELTPNTQQLRGRLAGQFNVAGSVESFQPQTIQASGQAKLTVGAGTITASNIQVNNGRYQAQVVANNVPVQRLTKVPPQFQGDLTGQLNVAGSVTSFQPQTIQASGQGKLNVAGGTITASNIQVNNGRYQTQIQANNVPLQKLAAVPPQFQGALTGQLNVTGSVASFQPQTIQASGQGRLNVVGGTITASNIQVNNGRYQAVVDAAGVQLTKLNQQLRGQLSGRLQVAGALNSATLAKVNASGQVQLSQGLPGLERPLTAAIAWNGEKLAINQLTAPGLNVSGDILANATKAGIPEITALNLNVKAQDYNLQQLPINLPNQVAVKGKVDFDGRVTGKLPLPNVTGQIALRDLVVQDIAFEPLLTGNIDSAQGRGLNLDLIGNSDRIAVNLDGNNRPQSFLVQWQNAVATGQFQGNNIALNVQNFPLQILNVSVPPALRLGTGKIAGLITGDLQLNQQTFAANGNLAIANPKLGRIQGDQLTAQFNYADGKATLTSSEFVKGSSIYAFAGSFGQTPQGPQLQGKLNVNQGNIQDVLTVAQIFDIQDFQRGTSEPAYGKAADLTTYARGLPNQPLLDQLRRFYEIEAEVAQQQQQRRDSTLLPELADLRGTFNGEVALDTATANGLSVQFDINGQNFAWGKEAESDRFYSAKQIVAQGSFENGVLQLRPLRIELDNSLLAFTGNIGGKDQSGQLRVTNFPIALINNFVKLPIDITGNLNATAALAGGIANPQAQGELEITDGTLNQKAVESATASFSYTNSRLNFGSNVTVAGPEPVNITGSIPYQLPFATTPPTSNEISLDVKVRNEGLALLNLLTDQIAFEKGEGDIDLKVRGTRQRPELTGIASIEDATFAAQALPGKIRQVTGKIQFDFDRILVESLQGKFSRGQVVAAGELPVFNNGEVASNPLKVNLDQLNLNLKGLYKGGASGNLQIVGSALNPVIGGQISLYDGQVLLAESTDTNQTVTSNSLKANKQNKTESRNNPTRLNNLKLTLGKNIEITRPPILSFLATGNLIVNGALTDPIPDGTIRLQKGGVNLFTTQFNLVRGYKNTATFRADQPRDPILDVQLLAKVLDAVQTSEFTRSSTIGGLGSLESVRVEARVQGPASKLNETLELTSSPSRSQTEIVALLGGGFIDTQGRADSTLGLINIAGSAVFNNFQTTFNQIANSLGLSEFRVFPTVISDNPEAGRSSSSLELAAEAGIDISTKFSISSIKILTANDPFQWGLNYRINDELRVRASTNLEDDSRAVIEYQTRF